MNIESKVFETVENAIKNDVRYKDYFIIVRGSDNFYYLHCSWQRCNYIKHHLK